MPVPGAGILPYVGPGLARPPSRRRARISPREKPQAIRLPGNKAAAWRIAAGTLVVPLLVNIVSFVFAARILLPVFLPVDLLFRNSSPWSTVGLRAGAGRLTGALNAEDTPIF
jgi:hypothetical protein